MDLENPLLEFIQHTLVKYSHSLPKHQPTKIFTSSPAKMKEPLGFQGQEGSFRELVVRRCSSQPPSMF